MLLWGEVLVPTPDAQSSSYVSASFLTSDEWSCVVKINLSTLTVIVLGIPLVGGVVAMTLLRMAAVSSSLPAAGWGSSSPTKDVASIVVSIIVTTTMIVSLSVRPSVMPEKRKVLGHHTVRWLLSWSSNCQAPPAP